MTKNKNEIAVLVARALASRTVYGTSPLLSSGKRLRSEQLYFYTLDEASLVEEVVQKWEKYKHQQRQEYEEYKRQQRNIGLAIKIGASLLGALAGIHHSHHDSGIDWNDGLNGHEYLDFANDVVGGAAMGFGGGNMATALMEGLDTRELKKLGLDLDELGLGWINKTPQSYLYSLRSHRGHSIRRVLLVLPHPETSEPCIAFAIQFPDGYVAFLNIIPETNIFAMTGDGFGLEMNSLRQLHIEDLLLDDGKKVPVQLWEDSYQEQYMIAIPYNKPHHSIY